MIAEGVEVHVFDPMIKKERIHQDLTLLWEARNLSKKEVESKLKRCVIHSDNIQAVENAFAIAILTEWDEFKFYDWEAITKKTNQPAKIFDGRNVLRQNAIKDQYFIGK